MIVSSYLFLMRLCLLCGSMLACAACAVKSKGLAGKMSEVFGMVLSQTMMLAGFSRFFGRRITSLRADDEWLYRIQSSLERETFRTYDYVAIGFAVVGIILFTTLLCTRTSLRASIVAALVMLLTQFAILAGLLEIFAQRSHLRPTVVTLGGAGSGEPFSSPELNLVSLIFGLAGTAAITGWLAVRGK